MPPINHHLPPRPKELDKKSSFRSLLAGLAGSSVITGVMMLTMFTANLPVNVVLPTSAPIWMGFATMLFMTLKG